MRAPILTQSLRKIACQKADGSLTSRDLVAMALARHDPALNACNCHISDLARNQATAADAAFAAGVRLGGLQGVPVGLRLIGARNTEARLLALARHIEAILAKADVWHSHLQS